MVVFKEFVQVDTEQLKDEAEMLPPSKAFSHSHNVMLIIHVHSVVQELKHPHFYSSLQESMPSLRHALFMTFTALCLKYSMCTKTFKPAEIEIA